MPLGRPFEGPGVRSQDTLGRSTGKMTHRYRWGQISKACGAGGHSGHGGGTGQVHGVVWHSQAEGEGVRRWRRGRRNQGTSSRKWGIYVETRVQMCKL